MRGFPAANSSLFVAGKVQSLILILGDLNGAIGLDHFFPDSSRCKLRYSQGIIRNFRRVGTAFFAILLPVQMLCQGQAIYWHAQDPVLKGVDRECRPCLDRLRR